MGHSYLPNDQDFCSIETERRKRNTVYVPEEWAELILKSGENIHLPLSKIAPDNFVSLVPVSQSFVNRKTNKAKQGVQSLQMKWIRLDKDKPLQFQYHYSLNTLSESEAKR